MCEQDQINELGLKMLEITTQESCVVCGGISERYKMVCVQHAQGFERYAHYACIVGSKYDPRGGCTI